MHRRRRLARQEKGGEYVFSDGSLLESRNMGGGGCILVGSDGREQEIECGIGDVATVWDGEVAGMAGGLAKIKRNGQVLILLADSKAAIAAVRKAGKTGKATLWDLREVINTISEVKDRGGEFSIGWVTSHIGILGNEAADAVAKKAAEGVRLDDHEKWMTGGYKAVGEAAEKVYS